MLYFANSAYLYLLLLVPLFPVVFGLMRRLRARRLAKFADKEQAAALMPSASASKQWVRVILFSIAFASFVLGIARPQIGAKLSEHKAKGVEVMICLDVSNSMLAQDYSPCRLDRAKLAISRFVDKLQDDRIGLIVFAGQSFVQLPITTDYVSAKMFLGSVNTESVPVQGTAIGDAIRTAMRSFSAQSSKSRVIIIITDGENHEDDAVAMAREAAEAGVRVFTLGVGSPEGKPIPMGGELLKDKDGNIVVTKLDEQSLQEIAQAGNGAYVRAGNSEFGLNPIIDSIKKMDAEEFSSVVFEEFDEQYMYFFAFALVLFVIQMLIGGRKARVKLFNLLLCVTLSGAASFNMQAQTTADRREVRSGNRDFRKKNYKEAEIDYRRALVKDSTSVAANYNLANTLYRMENYQEAAKYAETAENTSMTADVCFNKGDIALQNKDYNTALEAFKRSLLLNPGDLQAKENYIYAKKMLENQQNNGGGGGQNDQNQDQNNDQNQDQNQNQNQDQNQDQNNDQNQDQNQDQNNDQNRDRNQDQNQNQDQQLTNQAVQQLLQAIEAKEKDTQEKVKKEKALQAKSRQREKNW